MFVSRVSPNQAALLERPAAAPSTAIPRTHAWAACVVLVTIALCMPFTRVIFSFGDEGVILHGAERLLQGERIYTDFFEFLPPGAFLMAAGWMSVAGVSLLSARILAILTITGIACFSFLSCRRASRDSRLSAFLTVAWVVMSQGLWTQVGHHWFTSLAACVTLWASLAATEDGRVRPALIAGLAAGMAAMTTPTRGALAMLAGLSQWLNLRRHQGQALQYVIGCAVVPVSLIGWLAWNGSLSDAIADVIVFTAHQYAPIQVVSFGDWANAQNSPLVYVFPASLALLALTWRWRRASIASNRMDRVGAAFAFAGFAGCFPRPDVSHIAFAVPLALPLVASCLSRLVPPSSRVYRPTIFGFLGVVCLMPVLSYAYLVQQVWHTPRVPTPRGEAAFFGMPGAADLVARVAALPPGDSWFYYPYVPLLPFLTERRDVARYDVLIPGYTRPAQYEETCLAVLEHVTWAVFDRDGADPTMLRRNYPALREPHPNETAAFEEALSAGFTTYAADGSFELLRNQFRSDETACSRIAAPGASSARQ
jgi:hypothetical protein